MNLYQELDLEQTLQCPVCMELPEDPIYMCQVGHNICTKCKSMLASCPFCQSAITNTRNFSTEETIAKFSLLRDENGEISFGLQQHDANANTEEARTVKTNLEELRALKTPEGVYRCVLQSCQKKGKTMGVGVMHGHLRNTHPRLLNQFPNLTATFEHNFDDFLFKRSQRKYSRAVHVHNMGLFFLIVSFTPKRCMNCCVARPAPIAQSDWFDYGLEFENQEDRTRLQFADKVESTLREEKWLLERGKVWVVPSQKHHLEIGSRFSIRVKIVYNKPPE